MTTNRDTDNRIADCYRLLANALDDIHALRNLVALMPWAVSTRPVPPVIPQQRTASTPCGVPARPRTTWGAR